MDRWAGKRLGWNGIAGDSERIKETVGLGFEDWAG